MDHLDRIIDMKDAGETKQILYIEIHREWKMVGYGYYNRIMWKKYT